MLDVLLKYVPIFGGALLILSALSPPQKNAKWYGRVVIGIMGILLIYFSVHRSMRYPQ